MIKNLGSPKEAGTLLWKIHHWVNYQPNQTKVSFHRVDPAYTSQIHFQCPNADGDKRNIKRGADWEFGECRKCGQVNIDTHLNACLNIAKQGWDPPP